jgi:7,8-dihydropterin-6-yl-methyl-4-(beta-D-ribofuranosyl)aminobenzene 5'-phosphate synthase
MCGEGMKITCLVDNTAQRGSGLWGEHGLAFLIETEAGRVLYDTGQSGTVLMHNMEALGIDPATIDALAISHAHYDHTGALSALLARTRLGLPLYAHTGLFEARYSKRANRDEPRSIGVSLTREALEAQVSLRLSQEPQKVWPGIWTAGEIMERPEPEGRSDHHLIRVHSERANEEWIADPYRDDLSLVVQTGQGLILLCGCCHAGLLNTLAHVERTFRRPIVAIAGGTHLANADGAHLKRVGEVLIEMESVQRIYLNHCSGEASYVSLLLSLGPSVVRPCPAGTGLDLEGLS